MHEVAVPKLPTPDLPVFISLTSVQLVPFQVSVDESAGVGEGTGGGLDQAKITADVCEVVPAPIADLPLLTSASSVQELPSHSSKLFLAVPGGGK